MRIIPAIDLLRGNVVHAVAGRRDQYQPIKSCLAADSRPASIARGLIDKLGLTEFYVANLDAIAGGEPSWESYDDMIRQGASLSIDAGIADVTRARAIKAFADDSPDITGIVVGSESLADAACLSDLV